MFWIHGGGFQIGVGSLFEGMDLHPLAAVGDVIVVSINYRLNSLGFLSTGKFTCGVLTIIRKQRNESVATYYCFQKFYFVKI